MNKRFVLLLVGLTVFLAACAASSPDVSLDLDDWRNVELVDVLSGEQFSFGSFDKPVFIESFAVWCPSCTQQQLIIKEFHEGRDDFVSVGLNTDPNENADNILEHSSRHGFDWYFVVSPPSLTRELMNVFGTRVVSAPSVPIILLCPSGEAHFLRSGVKTKEVLAESLLLCEG